MKNNGNVLNVGTYIKLDEKYHKKLLCEYRPYNVAVLEAKYCQNYYVT